MDGTLWDSAENVAASWNAAVKQSGVKLRCLKKEDIQGVMGKTMDEIAELLFAGLDREARNALLAECCRMENDYLRANGGVLYDGVEETLRWLAERYTLFIVSNCQKGYIEAFLDFYGLWDCFTDIECYGNTRKAKGENIRLVAERNGLQQAVYVGDIQGDYDASRQAGVAFIHAAYGFGTIDADVPKINRFAELADRNIF